MTGEQLRAGRAVLKMTRDQLAEASGVSAPTIKRLEAMDGLLSGHTTTIQSLERAMIELGLTFIPENGGGAGVRLAKGGKLGK